MAQKSVRERAVENLGSATSYPGSTRRTTTIRRAAARYVDEQMPRLPYTTFQGTAHRRLREIRAAAAQAAQGQHAGPFPQDKDTEDLPLYAVNIPRGN